MARYTFGIAPWPKRGADPCCPRRRSARRRREWPSSVPFPVCLAECGGGLILVDLPGEGRCGENGLAGGFRLVQARLDPFPDDVAYGLALPGGDLFQQFIGRGTEAHGARSGHPAVGLV